MKPQTKGGRANQLIFDLKQRTVVALNKLGDRDTCKIAAEELERTAQTLTPDGVFPFLSCIADTDKEQKSGVRKECVRLMATLATSHPSLVGPHLPKMVASVVKRLRDPDSVVRDACVETMAVLAASNQGQGGGDDRAFVVLVKPLFEAMGEQNKQVQSGAALCLARVIDNTHRPSLSILPRMLTRTLKLLKNPHFMAKPAVIELITSIIQAGGAPSQNVLSAAMNGILEALKCSDWLTRKAAALALGEIASSRRPCLGSFKASSVRSLESCRFDKVKPVRDVILHALQYWKSLPGIDTPEPSETGSSIKENSLGGDYSDLTSTGDSVRKDKVMDSAKRRIPLSIKRTCQNYVESKHSKTDDWHIDIAIPKIHNDCLADAPNDESEGSSVTKTLDRMSTDLASTPDIGCEYVPMDDKQDSSSVSNIVAKTFETKFVAVSHESLEEGGLLKQMGRNQRFSSETINSDEQMYSAKMHDHRCLDSTVTDISFQPFHGCCPQVASEMIHIRKQLSEIENKQSNLIELLQVFSTGVMDNLSMLQTKVSGLENEIERMAHVLEPHGRRSDSAISKLLKQDQNFSSPRLSTFTPRPSVDIHNRQPLSFFGKSSDIWEEKTFGRSRSINSGKQGEEKWNNSAMNTSRIAARKDMQKSSGQVAQSIGQTRKNDAVFATLSNVNSRQNCRLNNNFLWQRVKGFLSEGDFDSAYVEALCSGNELVLVELLDETGPVLESLSDKTISDVLGTLGTHFLEQRFTNFLLPWLQQVVDLSTTHGPDYLVLSPKARRKFLSAVQEAVNMEFSSTERRSVIQLAMKLRQIWG